MIRRRTLLTGLAAALAALAIIRPGVLMPVRRVPMANGDFTWPSGMGWRQAIMSEEDTLRLVVRAMWEDAWRGSLDAGVYAQFPGFRLPVLTSPSSWQGSWNA